MPYSPFDKPINAELTTDDLRALVTKEVKEGYYVEYKSAKPDNKKIGHSLASLANTFGGWYVVGVVADKTQNVATEVCGFAVTDWPDPKATVRDVVKTHISPGLVFFPQLVPVDREGSRFVLVVYVPGGQDAPFVTQDGRIYVRVQDSSDPLPANNRVDLDRLLARGRESKAVFADFCRDTRTFSQADAAQGWLHVFIMPYPQGLIERFDLPSEDGLAHAMQLSQEQLPAKAENQTLFTGGIPFNAAQVTSSSVILRQSAPARTGRPALTVQLFQGGSAKFHIPLAPLANPFRDTRASILATLQSPEVQAEVRTLKEAADADSEESLYLLKMFDLGQLWLTLTTLLNFYEAWLGDDAARIDLKVALALEQVWRYCPFLDVAAWADHVRKYGLPVMQDSRVRDPSLSEEAFLIKPDPNRQLWWSFVPHVTQLVGLPSAILASSIVPVLERASKPQKG